MFISLIIFLCQTEKNGLHRKSERKPRQENEIKNSLFFSFLITTNNIGSNNVFKNRSNVLDKFNIFVANNIEEKNNFTILIKFLKSPK